MDASRLVEPIIFAVEPYGGSVRSHRPQLPLVYWDDAAVTRGDGVFESLLFRKGQVHNLKRHAQRFVASAQALDLPAPDAQQWIELTQLALEQWFESTDADAKCVWTYTRGRASTQHPSAWLTVTALPDEVLAQREQGVRVLTTERGFRLATDSPPPWLHLGAKTLNYASNMAALRYAKREGFDDVIFVEGERILEGATSTVVAVRGTKLRTPAPRTPGEILSGTTQASLFKLADAQGWNCKAKELDIEYLTTKADSVWLVSSVRMFARVRRINDIKLPRPSEEHQQEMTRLIELSQSRG